MPGNGHDPGTVTMAVLAMAALGAYQFPAAVLKQVDQVADFHGLTFPDRERPCLFAIRPGLSSPARRDTSWS